MHGYPQLFHVCDEMLPAPSCRRKKMYDIYPIFISALRSAVVAISYYIEIEQSPQMFRWGCDPFLVCILLVLLSVSRALNFSMSIILLTCTIATAHTFTTGALSILVASFRTRLLLCSSLSLLAVVWLLSGVGLCRSQKGR